MIRKFASKTLDLLLKTLYNIIIMKVDNQIVQEADNLSKETRIPFRECLDTLVRAYRSEPPPMYGMLRPCLLDSLRQRT